MTGAEHDEVRDVLEPPRWGVHHPTHMKGWEAFGVTAASPPTVRRLGVGWDGKGKPGTEKWHPHEVVNGVATVEIHSHGDHPRGAYVYVVGTDKEAVEHRWHAVAEAFEEMGGVLWPET